MPARVDWQNRGAIGERISELSRRVSNLAPLVEPVRRILIDGNRERSLAGTDVNGVPFAPVKPSTMLRRGGDGPPLAPRRAGSREVTGYHVDVRTGDGSLTFTASWPDQPWMEYHHTGTPRMPKRDPYGFREVDLEAVRALLREHIMKR